MENKVKRIAVFTSGGDSPGMNAALRAVVRTAAHLDLHVYGIYRGYQGMIEGDIVRLERGDVANIIHRGGTILKTARSKEFRTKEGRQKAYENLMAYEIDGCVVIGGNGSYAGAKVFYEEYGVPFIGIPGTIDNDIYGTDFTIGFDTAINTAVQAVDKIRDTAHSHNRIFFVEVMGRHSGYIALYTGIGSGAGFTFIPETNSSIDQLVGLLKKSAVRKKTFNMVIVAEGEQNGGALKIAEMVNEKYQEYETKVTIIGHIQRGGSPSAQDRVLASRLGNEAVLALINGRKNEALGIVDGQPKYVPFKDAIEKTKEPNKNLIAMAEILAL